MIESYKSDLLNLSPQKWPDFLREHVGVPGTKTNIELAEAFIEVGTLMDFKKFIQMGAYEAPANTPNEFLTLCGVLGFGKYLACSHDRGLLMQLRERANDSRKRVRDAVVRALKIIGHQRIMYLLRYAQSWVSGSYRDQRAAIAAICDPAFLVDDHICLQVLDLLDWVTVAMIEYEDEHIDGYEELRETLEKCWSIVVVAYPEKGQKMMERWIKENHPVINQIMIKNLSHDRMQQLDAEWVQKWKSRLQIDPAQ